MEQQAEKLIETTQKIQKLGGILETQPKEVIYSQYPILFN
jgi:hypothetical protein